MTRARAATIGIALLVVAVGLPPFVALAVLLLRWGVDVPGWEEWRVGSLLLALLDGRLAPADLWATHNEHRPVVSRVLLLALARASGWDVGWALAANVVVQGVTYLLLAAVALGAVRGRARLAMLPAIAASAWLLCSPVQWENWMWGWQLAVFALLCACASTALAVARWRGGWLGFGAMWLAAVAAALSFASGLALVVALPLAIALHPAAGSPRRRALRTLLSVAIAVGFVAVYATGLEITSPRRPPPVDPHAEWFLVGYYLLVYLGAPLGADVVSATRWGAAGLGLLAAGWLALPRGERRSGGALACLLLAGVAIGSALLTATARGGYGIFGALISRYTSIATLLWIAVLFLWSHALQLRLRAPRLAPTSVALAVVALVVLGLGAVSQRAAARIGTARLVEHHLALVECRECALGLSRAPASCTARLFRMPEIVRDAVPLGARGYGLVRDVPAPPIGRWRATAAPRAPGRLEVVDDAAAPGFVRIRGWAWHPFRREAVSEVLIAVDGRVVQRVPVGLPRPDVRATKRRLPLDVGFETRLARFRFPPGEHTVTAWLPYHGGTRVVRLPGDGRFVTEADPHAALSSFAPR